jgi:hypothetical protein
MFSGLSHVTRRYKGSERKGLWYVPVQSLVTRRSIYIFLLNCINHRFGVYSTVAASEASLL